LVVEALFEQGKVLSQMAGNNYLMIKSLPPLVLREAQLLRYACALERVCEMVVNEKTAFLDPGG
jgi:hypothetical protein